MNHYPAYPDGHLDPQAQALLTELAHSSTPSIASFTPEQARASWAVPAWFGAAKEMASVHALEIPGPAGRIGARVYVPRGDPPFPLVVFFHGGGFVLGTLDEFHPFCTFLAHGARCLVVSVDYRLAPEQRFPAAVEDAGAALQWLGSHARELGGDPERIAVAGDSAGGNLAAVSAMAARNLGFPPLALQVLICPWVDLSNTDTESFRCFGEGIWLSTASAQWYRRHYLTDLRQALLPQVSPLLAEELSGLSPTLVVNAEFDVLRDQARSYAQRLEASGNAVQYRLYSGSLHDFVTLPGLFDRAWEAIDDICAALRQAFARTP